MEERWGSGRERNEKEKQGSGAIEASGRLQGWPLFPGFSVQRC